MAEWRAATARCGGGARFYRARGGDFSVFLRMDPAHAALAPKWRHGDRGIAI